MDFWSRLLSHTPLSAELSRKDIAKDPVRRLHRFEKEYGQLLQTWRNSSIIRDTSAADTIELRIQELTNILLDESRRPLPHTCLAFAAEKKIYVPISKIAATSYNLYIIKEAVYFFGILIESEDDVFVENEAFATSLTNLFVRVTGPNSIRLDAEIETKVVELTFNVTTKIRLRPDILPAWFKPHQLPALQLGGLGGQGGQDGVRETESASHERFKGKTQRNDFPLFYVLVDYIHSEGKVGDFARTGLLYIIESASSAASASLEQWIVESDLSTLMATGLGALYSQLSRKLVIDHPASNLPPILALSDYEHPQPAFEVVSSCLPDFQNQLDTFLSHLLFWQDVLNHCRSVEVKSTLLEHFQIIFLQQILYPSLLESSDIDGGSSVAVLTYLRRILESLDHPDMINLILHYLLALPDPSQAAAGDKPVPKNAASAARKRKSMDLATLMAAQPEVAATPFLFNLVDLILACLKSHSQQTICVTLQLVSTILRRHHRYAVTTLLRTGPVSGVSSHRTIGAHLQETEFFMTVAGVIGGLDNFDDVYDGILRDVVVRLESHPCSLRLIAPKIAANNHALPSIPDSLPGAPRDVHMHTIRPGDPLLATILDRLDTFFINPVDANLSLTEAILDLATCGFISLEGWLLRHPDGYAFADAALAASFVDDADNYEAASDEQHDVSALQECRRRPKWDGLPRFITALQTLADQVAAFRQTIPRFDDLLQQRREAFQTADAPPPVLPVRNKSSTPSPHQPSVDEAKNSSPARPSAFETFAQRFMSEFNTAGSPRGRKESGKGPFGTPLFGAPFAGPGKTSNGGNASGMLGGYGLATPTSAKTATDGPPVPPKEFPVDNGGTGTLSRGASISTARSYSPSSQRREASSSRDGHDSLVASQMAAFQAVDRQILARRVGIPDTHKAEPAAVKPIPIDFKKTAAVSTPEALAEEEAKEPKELEEETEKEPDTVAEGTDDAGQGEPQPQPQPQPQPANAGSDSGGSVLPSENEDALAALTGAAEAVETVETVETAEQQQETTVTVSHILTNAIILQFFLFEVAALLQARAGLFDEVRFA